jgi:hypothetical protein
VCGGESVALVGGVFEKLFTLSAESYHGELLHFGAPAAHVVLPTRITNFEEDGE